MDNKMNDMDDVLLSRFLNAFILPDPSGGLVSRIMAVPYGIAAAREMPILPRGSYLMFAVALIAGIVSGLAVTHGVSDLEYSMYDTHPYMVSAASMLSKIFYM